MYRQYNIRPKFNPKIFPPVVIIWLHWDIANLWRLAWGLNDVSEEEYNKSSINHSSKIKYIGEAG